MTVEWRRRYDGVEKKGAHIVLLREGHLGIGVNCDEIKRLATT